MAEIQLPYMNAYGNITKALQGIQAASTPPRFTQDFLSTRLGLKGGTAKPVIPYLKRTGFLASDGTPTSLYSRFRNAGQRGAAAAEALKRGYADLYTFNEYAHDLSPADFKGLVVQATGLEESSRTLKSIIGSYSALKAFADFSAESVAAEDDAADDAGAAAEAGAELAGLVPGPIGGLSLGYTINLHLPPTSDIAVFNAIFKSLREHLLAGR
jgi:Family of unknown function (DUF5343)